MLENLIVKDVNVKKKCMALDHKKCKIYFLPNIFSVKELSFNVHYFSVNHVFVVWFV